MATCKRPHRDDPQFGRLPPDQGGRGRHICAGCAYDQGVQDGLVLKEEIVMALDKLDTSQAKAVRHASPHAAYALGYLEGVAQYYDKHPPVRGRRRPAGG